MTSPLIASLVLVGQLLAATSSSIAISEHATLTPHRHTHLKHATRTPHHHTHLKQKHRIVRRQIPADASVGHTTGLIRSGDDFVEAPKGHTYCPAGTVLVDEVNVCSSAATHLGVPDMSTVPVRSTEFIGYPAGCFVANNTVYFSLTNGTCPTCSLVCETVNSAADMAAFDPADGECKCGGISGTQAIKQMDIDKDTVEECVEQCMALSSCDAFEVDEPFNKRCSIWTGACNATESEATGKPMKCYIRKSRQATTAAPSF